MSLPLTQPVTAARNPAVRTRRPARPAGRGGPFHARRRLLRGAALVRMALDRELDARVLFQPRRIRGEDVAGIGANIGLVVVEEGGLQVARDLAERLPRDVY